MIQIILIAIFSSLIFFSLLYVYLIFRIHDTSLRNLNINLLRNGTNITKVLFVYPHPDDETMASGGLMKQLSKSKHFETHLILLTHGELGDEKLKISPIELANIRKGEAKKAANILTVNNFTHENFGDGMLQKKYVEMKKFLEKYILENDIDLVVTYERTGIYGHSDHVANSKAINELSQELKFQTLYSTIPKKIEELANMQSHMRDDVELNKHNYCEQPEFKLGIWKELFPKYKAAKSHQSQMLSHGRPLLLQTIFMPYEYYTRRFK